jgi:predicted transposase/invertase (TIGR01784 family)
MINALFNENYPIDDNIKVDIKHTDKDIIDADYTILIVDKLLSFSYNEKNHTYHMEVQTVKDPNMLFRMLRYGLWLGLDEMEKSKNNKKLIIPKQIAIFIEPNQNIDDYLSCDIKFFNHKANKYDSYIYEIPVFKIFDKDIKYFLENHLSLLLPFKISELNKELKNAKTDKDKELILKKLKPLVNEIISTLKIEYDLNFITYNDLLHILNGVKNVSDFFYKKLEPYVKLEEDISTMIRSTLTEEDKMKIEKKEKMAIAKSMKNDGFSVKIIMKHTGLTIEEIEKL